MKKYKKAVCLISGGLDSTVAAYIAKNKGYSLYFLFLNYGQKNLSRERTSVKKIAKLTKTKLKEVAIPYLRSFGSSGLFNKKILLDESNPNSEYVPFRNSQFLAIATAFAEVISAQKIYVGSTGGDHICPDNSKDYLDAFQKVIKKGTLINKKIKIEAPLVNTDKTGAVKIGLRLGVPFQFTWSCHNFIDKACGHCSNCKARLKAFKENNSKDPIIYRI